MDRVDGQGVDADGGLRVCGGGGGGATTRATPATSAALVSDDGQGRLIVVAPRVGAHGGRRRADVHLQDQPILRPGQEDVRVQRGQPPHAGPV